MNYWWVSQNKTFQQEIGGGYMWSPKTNSKGGAVQSYINMTKLTVGDVVLSFYKQKIQHIGYVTYNARTSPKPEEFGTSGAGWSDTGWIVPVDWKPLTNPFRPKDYMDILSPLLSKKHAPIRPNGAGNLAYLFSIEPPLAEKIFSISGFNADEINSFPAIDFARPEILEKQEEGLVQAILNDTSISATEKKAVVNARRGQGRFKSNLEQVESKCRLTGVSDRRFLIASHIKAWSECNTNAERLDGYNGLLMSPSADRLFDRGFISFDDNGDVLISSRIEVGLLLELGMKELTNVGHFREKQRQYLKFHRTVIFKK